jgi:uncharacterized protein (TIGR03067 family)
VSDADLQDANHCRTEKRSASFRVSSLPSVGPEFTLRVTMKTPLLMIVGLGLLLAACNRQAEAPPAAPKTDLDRFQGTWYLVMAMQDGKSLPEEKVKQTTIVFKGDTFRFPGSAEYATSKSGTIKLDETKTPKEMDAISTEKEVMLGIYALDEGGYKVCFAPAGKPRPTALGSAPGSGYILQVWQRQKKE